MALPAHKLKGEARQLGAMRLGDIAEAIEATARSSIEKQTAPDEVASEVSMLRSCFAETMQILAPQSQTQMPPQPVRAPAASPAGVRPIGGRPGTFGRRVNAG
jgi:hypothetical protein